MKRETEPLPRENELIRATSKLGLGAAFLRVTVFLCAVTLLVVLLLLSIGTMRLSQSGAHIVFSFVYTAFISLPSMVILNWLGHRFGGVYPRRVFLFYALALLCTATAGSFAAASVLVLTRLVPRDAFWHELHSSLPFAIVISMIIGMVNSVYETMRYKLQATTLELRTREVEQERANKLLAQARLSSLESRIAPHFLFNTLNSIAALIPQDPRRAEDTVAKLASLLRFSLNANYSGLVSLAQEMKVVRDYLEIEHTRFGDRLRYTIDAPAALDAATVPPLAVQTLVENCVKHVVARRSEGARVTVSATPEGDTVRLEVTDDGPGFSLDAVTPEHGLGNLVARIELLFGDRGKLLVTRRDGLTIVSLEFPMAP